MGKGSGEDEKVFALTRDVACVDKTASFQLELVNIIVRGSTTIWDLGEKRGSPGSKIIGVQRSLRP